MAKLQFRQRNAYRTSNRISDSNIHPNICQEYLAPIAHIIENLFSLSIFFLVRKVTYSALFMEELLSYLAPTMLRVIPHTDGAFSKNKRARGD